MLFYGFYPIPQVASLEVNSSIYWNYVASKATIPQVASLEAYRASINDPPGTGG